MPKTTPRITVALRAPLATPKLQRDGRSDFIRATFAHLQNQERNSCADQPDQNARAAARALQGMPPWR